MITILTAVTMLTTAGHGRYFSPKALLTLWNWLGGETYTEFCTHKLQRPGIDSTRKSTRFLHQNPHHYYPPPYTRFFRRRIRPDRHHVECRVYKFRPSTSIYVRSEEGHEPTGGRLIPHMYHRSREQHGKNQQARDEWSPTHTKTITHTLCKFIVEGLGDVAATFRKKVLGSWLFATVRRDKHGQERTRIHTNTVFVFKTYIVSRSTNRRRRIVEKEETKRSAAAGDNPKEMAAQQGSGRRLKPSARASRSFILSLVAPPDG